MSRQILKIHSPTLEALAIRLLFPIALIIICFFFSHCYVLQQTWGQWQILYQRRSIQEVIADPTTSPKIRAKLLFVEKVRQFAREELGLNVGEAYNYYTQLERSATAWNVSAAPKLAIKPKTWYFPIVGEIPYLGFFDYKKAQEQAQQLMEEGLDVRIGTVAGYSSLGWFNDPLLSTQLDYPHWSLARLLIHELAHRTLWFSGDVQFNESFASFVGNQGVLQFYHQYYDEVEYKRIQTYFAAQKARRKLYHSYTKRLEKLYNSQLPDEQKLQEKKRLLTKLENLLIQKGFRSASKTAQKSLNNADLLSYRRYNSGEEYFLATFQTCKKQWTCFLQKMKELQELSTQERAKVWISN